MEYMLQVKIKFRLKFFNLGWLSLTLGQILIMDPISFAAAFVHTRQNLKFFYVNLNNLFQVRETFSYPQAVY